MMMMTVLTANLVMVVLLLFCCCFVVVVVVVVVVVAVVVVVGYDGSDDGDMASLDNFSVAATGHLQQKQQQLKRYSTENLSKLAV